MKGIRMAVLGAALVLGVTTVASAQGGGGQARGGGRGLVSRLMTDITVSADVQTKIDTIAAKYMAQSRGLVIAGGGQMDDATRAKVAEINTKRNAEIRALLTPEQQTVFDKNLAAMPVRGNRGGGVVVVVVVVVLRPRPLLASRQHGVPFQSRPPIDRRPACYGGVRSAS